MTWLLLVAQAPSPPPPRDGLLDNIPTVPLPTDLLTGWAGDRVRDVMVAFFAAVGDSVVWLLGEVVTWLDDVTTPDLTQPWFIGQYNRVWAVALFVMVPLLVIGITSAVVRGGGLAKPLVGLVAAPLLTQAAIPLVQTLLFAVDWACAAMTSAVGADLSTAWHGLAPLLSGAAVGSGTAGAAMRATVTGPLLAASLFVAVAMLVLAVMVFLLLKLREVSVYLLALLAVVAYAAMVWPRARPWVATLVRAQAAVIVAKFPVVAAFALGAGFLGGGLDPSTPGVAFAAMSSGLALLTLAVVAPFGVVKLFGMAGGGLAESVGSRAAGGGVRERTVEGVQLVERVKERTGQLLRRDGSAAGAAGGAASGGTVLATAGAAKAAGAAADVPRQAAGVVGDTTSAPSPSTSHAPVVAAPSTAPQVTPEPVGVRSVTAPPLVAPTRDHTTAPERATVGQPDGRWTRRPDGAWTPAAQGNGDSERDRLVLVEPTVERPDR